MYKYIPFLAILMLWSCNGENTDPQSTQETALSSVITPPLTGDFTNETSFEIDPTVENKLETNNGSHFTIPANILVDANGKVVTDPVTVNFKQYHSAVDILASGIPMQYDTLGESFTFESAGMFSLNATANNQEVYVREGEQIDMNLASDKGDEQPFNFYELNENTGDWTYEHADTPVRGNPKFDPANYTPPKPEPVSEDAFVLDVNFDLSNYDELSVFSGIVWEYTGTEDSLDPRKNEQAVSSRWTDFELTPTYAQAYEYYMTMSNPTASFTTRVKAALDGEDLDLALIEFEKTKTEVAKKMDDLQKPYIRSVKIGGFGTYNYDYIYKVEEPAQVIADFDFGKHNDEKEHALVVVVYEDEEVVVNYPQDQWNLFGINTAAEAKIIAILPENQIAVYRDDISDCYGKKSHTFKMDVLDQKVGDKASLIDALASI